MSSYIPHKIRVIQDECMKSRDIHFVCLETVIYIADIVLVQELAIFQDPQNPENLKKIHLTNTSFTMIKPTSAKPRFTIYVATHKPFLKHKEQKDQIDNPDIICINVWTKSIEDVDIFNIYNERRIFDGRPAYTIERELLNTEFPPRTILAGDMNAHHLWWNSQTKTPENNKHLPQVLEAGELNLVNTLDEIT